LRLCEILDFATNLDKISLSVASAEACLVDLQARATFGGELGWDFPPELTIKLFRTPRFQERLVLPHLRSCAAQVGRASPTLTVA
jgi:hypothetical protein